MSELALKLIREAKEQRLTFLDLECCGLTELPDELFELEWLEQLNLGEYYFSIEEGKMGWIESANSGNYNQISNLDKLRELTQLQNLSIRGANNTNYEESDFSFLYELKELRFLIFRSFNIENINFISQLKQLELLDLQDNKIEDLKPLQKLTNISILNLNTNRKLSDISPIKKLNKMLILHLCNTAIYDLSPLKNFSDLIHLYISDTEVSDLSPLSKLTEIVTLDISGSKVNSLNLLNEKVRLINLTCDINGSENIIFFKNQSRLRELSISDEINLDFIKYLPSLEELEVNSSSKLESIAPLANHPSINRVVFISTRISDLEPLSTIINLKSITIFRAVGIDNFQSIRKNQKLERLKIFATDIDDISFVTELKSLKSFQIEYSSVENITALSACVDLNYLTLKGSKISNIEPLENLINLRNINLESSLVATLYPLRNLIKNGLEVHTSSYHPEYSENGIYVHNCPITFPPLEVVKQGNEAILRYFEEWEKQGSGQLFEAKIVVVGAGEAGKTTLIKKLLNPDYVVPNLEDKRTEGIVVNSYPFTGIIKGQSQDLKAHIWDFGGQELYHATHQFFLTSDTLYILVNDNRRNDTDFYYWLNTIKIRAGANCPTLVVFNAKDNSPRQIILGEDLLNVFGNLIKESIEVNFAAKDSLQINQMKNLIENHFSKLEVLGKPLPLFWVKVREALNTLSEEKITWSKYEEICRSYGITDLPQMYLIAQTFHNLGILLYFQDVFGLEDILILNPQWCIDAVYLALDTPEIQNDFGRFNEKTLAAKWTDKRFAGNQLQLLKLMQHFDLCYQIEGTHDYIAPQLLPLEEQQFSQFPDKGLIVYRFNYTFMPAGLLTRMIARLSRHIKTPYVWRNGVTLEWEEGTLAEVIENQYSREIVMRVCGPERKRRLAEIRKTLLDLHQLFRGLKFDELVACNCEYCINSEEPTTFTLQSLEDDAKHNDEVKCTKGSRKKIPARDILEGINYTDMPRIFISYSHKNMAYKDDFRRMIKPMEIGGQWKVWDDCWLLPGDNWNHEILRHLSEANVIVLLLTADFFNSDYINDIEMSRAIQRHEAGDALIIGIIVSDCMWEETPFRKIQMLPKDAMPVDRHPHPNEVWKAVANKIKEAIEVRAGKKGRKGGWEN
jgi:internalin A